MSHPIFTIGHSTHTSEHFVALLERHEVTAIADVRSHPRSRSPHFNRDALARTLRAHGIRYVFLGEELGARRAEPEVYDGDLARYEWIAQSRLFLRGLERLENGAKSFRIALMCAEKDPLTCHRAVLVARNLSELGHEVQHIREDGSIETTAQLDSRLLDATGVPTVDLFRPRVALVAEAYRIQGERIGYRQPAPTQIRAAQ